MGSASGVAEALQQDYILRANTNPVYFQPSEKHPNVFVGEVNNRDQSTAKRPRLGCAECLASDPNSGDLPSGGSITPSGMFKIVQIGIFSRLIFTYSGLRHSRLSTATAVASLQRQPECLTNPSFFAPLVRQKGDGDAPHCPTSIRPGIQSQDPSPSTRLVLPHRPSSEPTAQHNTLILNSPTRKLLFLPFVFTHLFGYVQYPCYIPSPAFYLLLLIILGTPILLGHHPCHHPIRPQWVNPAIHFIFNTGI